METRRWEFPTAVLSYSLTTPDDCQSPCQTHVRRYRRASRGAAGGITVGENDHVQVVLLFNRLARFFRW